MARPRLHIGDKNYSSWSMRPWLALRHGGVDFEEVQHSLPEIGGKPAFGAVSPNDRVPALDVDGVTVAESLAICEWAAEQTPSLWPEDPLRRAQARAVACEMHAGFEAIRRDMSCNVRRRLETQPDWPEDTREDLDRLFALWGGLRARYGDEGEFLFGALDLGHDASVVVAARSQREERGEKKWFHR